jgi:hypothetical protein
MDDLDIAQLGIILNKFSRVLACHCECMGLNAENMMAACQDSTPPYSSAHYNQTMQMWGLIDEKGRSLL